jgi:type I restriction enzyme S subunit
MIAAGKATTMGHIQRYHLNEAKVVIPTTLLLEKVDNLVRPLLQSIVKNNLELNNLSSIRDALLLKLVSGEIRVNVIDNPRRLNY